MTVELVQEIKDGVPINVYKVFLKSEWVDAHMGEFVMDVDGYFYYYPILEGGGFWEAHVLIKLGNKLNELNKAWDDQINEYFEKEKKREDEENENKMV